MVKRSGKRQAFLLADAMMGVAILATLITIFAAALGAQQRASRKLADSRAAWRAAEAALSELQVGHPAKRAEIHPAAGGNAPAGFVWVEAVASRGNATARLVGLVPKAAGGAP